VFALKIMLVFALGFFSAIGVVIGFVLLVLRKAPPVPEGKWPINSSPFPPSQAGR